MSKKTYQPPAMYRLIEEVHVKAGPAMDRIAQEKDGES
jgi:hypothetical protein